MVRTKPPGNGNSNGNGNGTMTRTKPPNGNGKNGKKPVPLSHGNALYDEWLTEDGLIRIQGWARDGLTNAQIAHNIGISTVTLWEWGKRFPNIANVLKQGKEVVDREVENKLFQRAMGYTYEETKTTIDSKGNKKVEVMKKKLAPDVTAQIFWLKNRKPGEWRDTRQHELTGKGGGPIQHSNKPDLSELTEEELTQLEELFNRKSTESDD